MLRVAVVGQNLERLEAMLEAARMQFAFDLERIDPETADTPSGDGRPILVFAEAPEKDRGKATAPLWALLKDLQQSAERSLVRVFVVSTAEDFDSAEAQNAWMRYTVVTGYERYETLKTDEIKDLVRQMVEIAAEPPPAKRGMAVGTRLRMPLGPPDGRTPEGVAEEYERHRFVSFLTGGMRETLVSLRQATQAIAAANPLPRDARKSFEHPFAARSAQTLFDAACDALYGSGTSGGRTARSSATATESRNPAWLNALRAPRRANRISPHVLLLGDTGTGKTLLARWMHRSRYLQAGADAASIEEIDSIFQDLNCGAISPNLIDSELFGGVRGAWSGLDRNTPGKIFCAWNGTLFLDEIGEMPLATQAILLKFLDDGGYYPVGGHGSRLYVPTTVIAATNRNLETLVEEGAFRRDLYERFRFRIRLPSLQDRRDYLEAQIDFVLQNPQINPIRSLADDGVVTRAVNFVSKDAMRLLRGHSWPGNFRELEQVLWRAVFLASYEGQETLLPRHLSLADSA